MDKMDKNMAFAAFAVALVALLPAGGALAQSPDVQVLAEESPQTSYIEKMHLVATGLEVDSSITPVAVDKIVAGVVASSVDDQQKVGAGILVRRTDQGPTTYRLRGLSLSADGALSGKILERQKTGSGQEVWAEVGSFKLAPVFVGENEFWKGPVTIGGKTNTFLGKATNRGYKPAEKARLITKAKAETSVGLTENELEIKALMKEKDDVRSRNELKVKCKAANAAPVCKAVLEKLAAQDLAGVIKILPDKTLTAVKISKTAADKAEPFLDTGQKARIRTIVTVDRSRSSGGGG